MLNSRDLRERNIHKGEYAFAQILDLIDEYVFLEYQTSAIEIVMTGSLPVRHDLRS